MTGALLMSTTLPTIIGMGVISRTTEVMFDEQGRRVSPSRVAKSKTITVGVASRRSDADAFATKYRRTLKRKGLPYTGRVKVKKVSGGYAITYRRG